MAKHTVEYLQSIIDYSPTTGLFTWKPRHESSSFNKMYVGKELCSREANDGFYIVKVNGVQYRTHRLAFALMTGDWPERRIRNITGDKRDCRWVNLAEITPDLIDQMNTAKAEAKRAAAAERRAVREAEREQRAIEEASAHEYLTDDMKEYMKEKRRQLHHYYRNRNVAADLARKAKRRARERDAVCPDADLRVIQDIYRLSRSMTELFGVKYHVDHLIPLAKGGKHHEGNLVVMRADYNGIKKDRIIPAIIRFFSDQTPPHA